MSAPDEIERLMRAAAVDRSRKAEYAVALWQAELWFPIDYHPELGNPYEPAALCTEQVCEPVR